MDPPCLPIEIVSLIAQHVDQQDLRALALVNKKFYTTIIPRLWRSLDIKYEHDFEIIVECMFSSYQQLGHHVRHLCFDPKFPDKLYSRFNDTLLMLFIPQVPQLEELVITEADNLTDTSFQHIPRHCPNLKSITIRSAHITTRGSIAALGQYGQNLRQLKLEICSELSLDMFATLSSCPMLQELHINSMGREPFEIDLVVDKAVVAASKLHRLTHLYLALDPTLSSYFSQQIVLKCTDAWPLLTRFTLKHAQTVDDNMLMAFLGGHPKLEHFAIESSVMTDRTMENIARLLPLVTSVGLTSCENLTYRGLRRFVRQCPQLQQIDITDCGYEVDRMPETSHNILRLVEKDIWLKKLDQETLDNIRLGPEPTDSDDNIAINQANNRIIYGGSDSDGDRDAGTDDDDSDDSVGWM